MRRSAGIANKQVDSSVVLMLAENNEALFGQRMKRVGDSNFARQNSGIMSYLPMPAANAQRPFTACSVPPNSTISILNFIYAASWGASPIIRSTVSTNSYPGTWPQSFQRISQRLKCPLKINGHLTRPLSRRP
jgi:hypothetical protein